MMVPDPSIVSFVFEGHNLNIGLNLTSFMRIGHLIEAHSDLISKVQEELKVDQNVEVSVRLATSPEEVLSEGAEPFINLLLKGISFGLRLNVWRKISDVLLKLVDR